MRLTWLNLEAYGLFSNQRLSFRQDARLHVIYGENEAGKSTALAAVGDALFGLKKSRYDFLHRSADLRLSAGICNAGGEILEFRRALYKPQLTDLAGAVLSPARLEPFLGALDRETFARAFGLDAQTLRKSGEELETQDGELGAALFAAASGLRGMTALKKAFEAEADDVLGARSSKKRRFDQARKRFDDAQTALRDHEMGAVKLKALRDEIADQKDARQNFFDQRMTIAESVARLERTRRTAPLLADIAEDRAALAVLGDAPAAPLGAAASLARALEEWREAERAASESCARLERQQSALDGVVPESPLIERAKDIGSLNDFGGRILAAREDLNKLQTEFDVGELDLSHLAHRVGLTDAKALRTHLPSDAVLARIHDIVAEGLSLTQQRATRQEDVERSEKNLAAKSAAAPAQPTIDAKDAKFWRAELKILNSERRLSEDYRQAKNAFERERNNLAREARKIEPPIENLAVLPELKLPSVDALKALARDFDAATTAFESAETNARAAHKNFAAAQSKLEALCAGALAPSPSALAQAREKRLKLFQALVAAAFEGGAADDSERAKILLAFDAAQREADHLADAMIADAAQGAARAARAAHCEDAEKIWVSAQKTVDFTQQRLSAVRARIDEAWRETQFSPTPKTMCAWRERAAILSERSCELATSAHNLTELEARIALVRKKLETIGAAIGSPAQEQDSLEAQFMRIDDILEQASEAFAATEKRQGALAQLSASLQEALDAREKLEARWEAWRGILAEALAAIGLGAQAELVEAQAAITAWSAAPAKILAQDVLQARIRGIERDARDFAAAVEAMRMDLGGDWPADPVEASRHMFARSAAAGKLEAKREELARSYENAREDAQEKILRAKQARTALEEFCARNFPAMAIDGDELTHLAGRLAQKEKLIGALEQKEARLAEVGDGCDEASLRQTLENFDRQTAESELAQLNEHVRQAERFEQEAIFAMRDAERRLTALGQSQAAEAALQRRRDAEAEMAQAARDYIVKKLSALLIGAAIERQRAGLQAPLLTRAGEFFSCLTGGAFVGVGQIYDENDQPFLAGRRGGGARVPIMGLSEGARDQLFLSLRLAYLEIYAAANEAPPFLADDLFSSFDDSRTAHGLGALVEIGARVQPILFTHHRFVVDAAREKFGDQVQVLELR